MCVNGPHLVRMVAGGNLTRKTPLELVSSMYTHLGGLGM